jgi:hypothetical protein
MQYRRIISAVLVPATLLLFTGCTQTVWVGPTELQPGQKLNGLVTAGGQEVKLDPSKATARGDTIYADADEDALRFPLHEVDRVGVVRSNPSATVALLLGFGLVAVVVISISTMELDWGRSAAQAPGAP